MTVTEIATNQAAKIQGIKSFVDSCVCTDETPAADRCSATQLQILDAAEPLFTRLAEWLTREVQGANLILDVERNAPACSRPDSGAEDGDTAGAWLSLSLSCPKKGCQDGIFIFVDWANLDRPDKTSIADLIAIEDSNTQNDRVKPTYTEQEDGTAPIQNSGSRDWCWGCANNAMRIRKRLQAISGVKLGAVDWAFQALKRRISGGEVKWLIPGIMQKAELAALFGPPKSGKSLLALEWAAKLATERKRVLYLDEENSAEAIYERLLDMGYEDVPSFLEYHSFGGYSVDKAGPAGQDHPIVALAKETGAQLVVFDSYAKFFVGGSQNDDAAINRAYSLVLKPLKALGIAVLRLDHTGHGETRRPAGSVQKLADVEHNWLIRAEDAPGRSARKVTLTHTENRTGRGADLITMRREIGPLRHVEAAVAASDVGQQEHTEPGAAVKAIIERLDAMSIPLDWGRGRCMDALKANGGGVKVENLSEAIRRRQE